MAAVMLAMPRLRRIGGRSDAVVYLRADEGLKYGQVIKVVDVIKHAGVDRIGFVYVLPEDKRPEDKRP